MSQTSINFSKRGANSKAAIRILDGLRLFTRKGM